MRVLVVTPWFPSAKAPGSGIFNLRDVELLARDHEVRVLHLIAPRLLAEGEPEEEAHETFSIRRVPFHASRPATLLSAARAIGTELRAADLLHTMAQPALIPTRLVRVPVPFVHTEHFSSLVTPDASRVSAVVGSLLATLFRRPTEVVAVSGPLARAIDRHRGRPCTVIGNRVMLPERAPTGGALERGRPLSLIAVGGAVERKGPVQAVETMIELRRRGIEASLTWVGEGPLSGEMRTRAERANVAEHFHDAGFAEPWRLSRLLLESDLFLLPVETETFGVAIAEALTHGLPVVATGTGGHEEFLPPKASRLITEREPGPLADAVEGLLDDPTQWSRAEIAEYARARFSETARLEAYREVYRSAAARNVRAPQEE
ncbi:glycosyltransferase [Leucobacter sp. CSA1]|uniref:Glycosyltransferase n=1 Tax=Leucobacter chromiisoli TaxID=2796471 RepID=A0A934Q6E5_9MICO|nr:glycosyltransferase [Leucobacter chromiisoli]MBK0417687.1 glycosyltransferase [Leucobacter chromiisoli]